jgi:hypothetical protein
MVKKTNNSDCWWKVLIVLTFLISAACLVILMPTPQYSYETKHIVLNNENIFKNWNVIDYTCDEGVEVSVYHLAGDSVYASTWNDADINYGQCMFKIKIFEGWK